MKIETTGSYIYHDIGRKNKTQPQFLVSFPLAWMNPILTSQPFDRYLLGIVDQEYCLIHRLDAFAAVPSRQCQSIYL